MKKRIFGRRTLAVVLSLLLAVPGNAGWIITCAAGAAGAAAKATASDAEKASASDAALLDEDGFLLDGTSLDDVPAEVPEEKTEQIGKALAGGEEF